MFARAQDALNELILARERKALHLSFAAFGALLAVQRLEFPPRSDAMDSGDEIQLRDAISDASKAASQRLHRRQLQLVRTLHCKYDHISDFMRATAAGRCANAGG